MMKQDFVQNSGECWVFHGPEGETEGDKVEESYPSAISGKQPPPGVLVIILIWSPLHFTEL